MATGTTFVRAGVMTLVGLLFGCSTGGPQIVERTVVVTQVVTAAPTDTPASSATDVTAATDIPTVTEIPSVTPLPVPTDTATTPAQSLPTLTPPVVLLPPFDGRTEFVQIGPDDTDTTVTYALVLEVQANDVRVGEKDGSGIDRVEFFIYDGTNLIYQHTERTAKYCAFGGGEPKCNQLDLKRGVTWPGTNFKIHNGSYGVRAIAYNRKNQIKEADVVIDVEMQ